VFLHPTEPGDRKSVGAAEIAVGMQFDFDKEASQTRDYCVAKNARLRAARQVPHGAKNACSQ
jgi:hypothetical protein